eukprot:scaffold152587_cov22-Tisochrysis_lutea.AAC.1
MRDSKQSSILYCEVLRVPNRCPMTSGKRNDNRRSAFEIYIYLKCLPKRHLQFAKFNLLNPVRKDSRRAPINDPFKGLSRPVKHYHHPPLPPFGASAIPSSTITKAGTCHAITIFSQDSRVVETWPAWCPGQWLSFRRGNCPPGLPEFTRWLAVPDAADAPAVQ